MAWFRVDDQFGSNPKVMQIPRAERHACLGLWLQAGVWSAQHLTDGRIPGYMLDELGANVSHRDRLVTVGLWQVDGDDVVFNDWVDYQPSRADVLAMREKERRRKEAYRLKKVGNTGQSPGGTESPGDAGHQRVSGHPDPTRPDPTRPTIEEPKGSSLSDSEESNEEGELLQAEWVPNRKHYDHAVSLGLNPEYQFKAFRDHANRVQRRQRNWNTAFTNWLKKAAEIAQQRAAAGQSFVQRAPAQSKSDEAQDFIQRLEAIDATRGGGETVSGHQELR